MVYYIKLYEIIRYKQSSFQSYIVSMILSRGLFITDNLKIHSFYIFYVVYRYFIIIVKVCIFQTNIGINCVVLDNKYKHIHKTPKNDTHHALIGNTRGIVTIYMIIIKKNFSRLLMFFSYFCFLDIGI